ncbi:putative phospholipid ABC transporter permease protein MlaE [bacterium BMS3Abin05]|nr:putative phospholipid ABC transporter permease protein MlaE [bacterium BMS3Abin05]GBE26516.1 putative phospholipid ABC transporter permease protein MlaE [bacterium BMS3Bbin03]
MKFTFIREESLAVKESGQFFLSKVREYEHHAGQLAYLFYDTIRLSFHKSFDWYALLEYLEKNGVQSHGIVMVTFFFLGMVITIQVAYSSANFAGASIVGAAVASGLVKEFGPLLTGLLVGGRVGAGMTSAIGTMSVTEQIDAIRSLGANPIKKIVVPRFWSIFIMMPILTIMGDFWGMIGGLVVAKLNLQLSAFQFMNSALQALYLSDIIMGVIKSAFYAIVISMIGCYNGFNVRHGAEDVGKFTTNTVVTSFILIMIADYFLTKLLIIFIGG